MYSRTKQAEWLAKADQAERRALELDDTGTDVHIQLGRILRTTGQTDQAIQELQIALQRDPNNLPALLQIALAYEDARRTPEAEGVYRQMIRLRPSYAPAYTDLGILYWSVGQYERAEEPLGVAVKLEPESENAHTNLATLYYSQEKLKEAEQEFTRSIQLKPTAAAYTNRCGVEFALDKMASAERDCRKSVELDAENAQAWGNLADAMMELPGRQSEARATYERALDVGQKSLGINPNNPSLLSSMALYASKTGQGRSAMEYADMSMAQGSGLVNVLYKAGKAIGLAGDCLRGMDLIRQALEKGFPKGQARRDKDLKRLRAAPHECRVPTIL